MTTKGAFKFSYIFIGLGLGAVGGLMSALLGHKKTREALRERSNQSLDYLNQQAGKLRDSTDMIVKKGKEFIGPFRDGVKSDTPAEKPAYHEDKRENLAG